MSPALRFLILTLLGGWVAWQAFALCRPLTPWRPPAMNVAESPPETLASAALALPDLAVIWERDLHQPVVDPPKVAKPKRKPPPPPSVRLIGTVIEAERAFGIFEERGTVQIKAIGESIGDYQIILVERGRAVIKAGDREVEIHVPWHERLGDGP